MDIYELNIPTIAEEDNTAIAINPILSPEIYLNSDSDIIKDTGSQNYLYGNIYGYEERLPVVSIPFRFWVGDSLYMQVDVDIKEQPGLGVYPTYGIPENNYSNIPSNFDQIYQHLPDNYYLSYSNNHTSAFLGSSEYSIGLGETGKLLLSQEADHIPAARFSFFNNHFRYNFTYLSLQTGFGNFGEYKYNDSAYNIIDMDQLTQGYNNDIYGFEYSDYMDPGLYPYKGFLTHTVELRTLSERLYIGISESVIYARAVPELLIFSPLTIWHNTNNGEQTNSLLTLDLQFAINKWSQIYASGIMDQFTVAHESNVVDPEAYGFLYGIKTSVPHNSGYFKANLEYVFTNDWLYTHKYFLETATVAQRNTDTNRGGYDIRPLGYQLGNDVSAFHFKFGYEEIGNYSLNIIYNSIQKGPYDVFMRLPQKDSSDNSIIINPKGDRATWPIAYSNVIGIEGSYNFKSFGTGKMLLYYTHTDNYKNQIGDKFNNFELTLSITIDPVELSKSII